MLKLTNRRDRSVLYLAPEHIVSIGESGQGSTVHAGGTYFEVYEKPSEIMVMEEMVRHLHPMVTLSQQPSPVVPAYPLPPPNIISSVRGNCGTVHATVEEWRNCRACDTPARISTQMACTAAPDPMPWQKCGAYHYDTAPCAICRKIDLGLRAPWGS